mmetsp:Transcript_21180/g.68317  ORF Transcript_21180/g.68317 Transcript_21180/m.68317 type:complete len:370 (-) Transcript_21180:228-1337(-)
MSSQRTSRAQPELRTMEATGHLSWTIFPRAAMSSFVASPSTATLADPQILVTCAGTGGASAIGRQAEPRTSRSACSSKSMRRITSRGRSSRPTKCAVACSQPISAASIVSTGSAAVSVPPSFAGVSVDITCPRPVSHRDAHPAPRPWTEYVFIAATSDLRRRSRRRKPSRRAPAIVFAFAILEPASSSARNTLNVLPEQSELVKCEIFAAERRERSKEGARMANLFVAWRLRRGLAQDVVVTLFPSRWGSGRGRSEEGNHGKEAISFFLCVFIGEGGGAVCIERTLGGVSTSALSESALRERRDGGWRMVEKCRRDVESQRARWLFVCLSFVREGGAGSLVKERREASPSDGMRAWGTSCVFLCVFGAS